MGSGVHSTVFGESVVAMAATEPMAYLRACMHARRGRRSHMGVHARGDHRGGHTWAAACMREIAMAHVHMTPELIMKNEHIARSAVLTGVIAP